jgi:4,5-dihydroxyphthalate decarboxylase
VIYPEVLPAWAQGSPHVGRLFEDYKAAEQDYYRRTGIFPIMHAVVVKASVLERFPWVARNLLHAFQAAKELAYRKLRNPRTVSLAWAMHALEEQTALMGPDPWPCGLEPNRKALETLIAYAAEEGLIEEKPAAEELFAAESLGDVPKYVA